MQYRRFGRTNLSMPVISTGGMRYQDGWQDKPLADIKPETTDNMRRIIQHSLDVGISHIETARGYGPSERQLGQILPHHPRERLIVQTKLGPTDTGDEFLQHFSESLERLQLDHVDLLAVHGINTRELLEQTIKPGGCLQAARELQRRGKARWIGFSTHGPLDVITDTINTTAFGGFDYVNLHWYYIFRRNEPAIAAATARDMGVFIISPSDKGGMLYKPTPTWTDACAPLHPIVFNDLWCLRDKRVHTLSLGSASVNDYDLHVEADALLDQADALVPPIERKLDALMQQAIGHASPEAFSWSGVPECFDAQAPKGANLPIMLWLRNLAVGWGMTDYAKMRFNLIGNGGHWFPGCKPAELGDVTDEQLAQAVARSPFAERLPAMVRESIELLGGGEVKRLSES